MQPLKHFLSMIVLVLLTQFSLSAHAENPLPELGDMQALGAQAKEKELPIMLMFSAKWCEYCEVLKEQVIYPMMINGMYEGKVMYLRNVGVDEPDPIRDFQGKRYKNKAAWAFHLSADLTPTFLFVDGNGKEIAERIVGIPEVTLFAALIHSRVNDAYQAMGIDKKIPATPEKLAAQQKP